MALITCNCHHCNKEILKEAGHVNRANSLGMGLYCNKTCFGLANRNNKTIEQKKAEKKIYDEKYREHNFKKIKAKKHAYFKRTYDKEKAAIVRKQRSSYHAEYCRRPDYREWKKQYDAVYRAKKEGGEFWESLIIINMIQKEYDDKMVRQQNNLHNKSQKRKRLWKAMTKNSQQSI